MPDRPDARQNDDGGVACSRRTVLRAGGAAVGTVATSGIAAAQETATGETENGETISGETLTEDTATPSPIITMAVTLEQRDIEGDLTGMWIHVGRPVRPTEAAISDQCDIVDWGDEDTFAYEVKLIDRRGETYKQSITLYLPESAEVGPGDLFIINKEVPCESGYIGIRLEQIGARNVDAGIKPGEGITETEFEAGGSPDGGGAGPIGGIGPGFGLFAAAGGLLGGGWLLDRRRDD